MFWIRNWRVAVIEIKMTLLIINFPELPAPTTILVRPATTLAATTATTATTATASTKAPTGLRREKIFQVLNNRIQL